MSRATASIEYTDTLQYIRNAFSFLYHNPDLFLLPLLNLFTAGIFVKFLIWPVIINLSGFMNVFANHPVALIFLIISYYFSLTFLIIFFNTALIAISLKRFRNQKMNLGQGFLVAIEHLPTLIAWTFVSSTLGLVVSTLEHTFDFMEKWVDQKLGFSWSVAAYFVLPIVITHPTSSWAALKQSGKKFELEWRKTVSINMLVGMTFLAILVLLLILLKFVPYQTALTQNPILYIIITWFFIALTISTALESIIKSALYLYVFMKVDPKDFDIALLSRTLVKND